MWLKAILILFVFCDSLCTAQTPSKYLRRDTSVKFEPDSTFHSSYEQRRVPYNSNFPIYLQLGYGVNDPHYEFFRVDSSHYLAYEYYNNKDSYYPTGLTKSKGMKVVKNELIDSAFVDQYDINGKMNKQRAFYYKAFTKEGLWEEFEDNKYLLAYWEGKYKNDKRVGIWSRLVNVLSIVDTVEKVNYDMTPPVKIATRSIADEISLDSLRKKITGTWILAADCDDVQTLSYHTWEEETSQYRSFYEFKRSGKFLRLPADRVCTVFKNCTAGQWELIESEHKRYIKITFKDGTIWKLWILYLDDRNKLVMQRA